MNELLCKACTLSLRHDSCRDEMVCVECGLVYPSEMMHDGYYENSSDEQTNEEVRRALFELRVAGFDVDAYDIDTLQCAASDVFRLKPLSRREAVVFALCGDSKRVKADKICRILKTPPTILSYHSAASATTQHVQHVTEYAFEVMDKLGVHRRHRFSVVEGIEALRVDDFMNPFALACLAILSTVPEVGDTIFETDKRFTKNMYARYNERCRRSVR